MATKFVVKNPVTPKKRPTISAIAMELQRLQRLRAVTIKSRIMNANRLQALVAGTIGFDSKMDEKKRRKVFSDAQVIVDSYVPIVEAQSALKPVTKEMLAGAIDSPMADVIKHTLVGTCAFNRYQDGLEKQMLACVKQLPVVDWVAHKNQRGFGLQFLAIIIGETGDLGNYANPGKVWRRLSCAPWSFDGKTLMGATWKSGKEGKLPAGEEGWSGFGYSPRRRSISYLIGEGLMKQNFTKDKDSEKVTWTGPYRKRYDEARETFKKRHPDYSDLRCHRHGMLLAAKLLLKNLWIEWNK